MSDWYDHPEYFDLLFSDETEAEVEFFQQAFQRFAGRTVTRVFEPGCGSGRLLYAMAQLGYHCTGLDLNAKMLQFAQERLVAEGLTGDFIQGDMARMDLGGKFDAAFCTFNTFRHLLSDEEAICHLRSVADHLNPGGLYILGFHCIPLDACEEEEENWDAESENLFIDGTLKVVGFDRSERQEILRVVIKVIRKDAETGELPPDKSQIDEVQTEFPLRLYTHDEAADLLMKVNDVLEIVGVYDFDYEIDEEREIDDDLTDAVFVLRRR